MPLWSLWQEKVNSLLNQKENKKNEIMLLEEIRIEDIWINDIEELIKVLDVKLNKILIFFKWIKYSESWFLNKIRKLKLKKKKIAKIIPKLRKLKKIRLIIKKLKE